MLSRPTLRLTREAVQPDDATLAERIRDETRRPFDLSAGPPIRATLLPLAGGGAVLLLAMHHILSDGPDYLAAAEDLARAGRVAVVGLGQSAAEIFLDLHGRGVAVDIIGRGPAMRPADSSPFANQVFDAGYTNYLYGLPPAERAELLRAFHNTKCAVVDPDLIDAVYGIFYQQKVEGAPRHAMLTRHEVVAARCGSNGGGTVLDLAGLDDGGRRERRYGAVVLAAGYRRRIHKDLLQPMERWLAGGEVGRDYRLPTVPGCTAGLYLQGCCEATHGLSDTLLSILPIRAQEIATALTADAERGRGQQIRKTTSAQ